MLATIDVLKKKRDLLKIKRDLLFKEFIDHPNDCHFALEIKTMDDEIADYTHRIERELLITRNGGHTSVRAGAGAGT